MMSLLLLHGFHICSGKGNVEKTRNPTRYYPGFGILDVYGHAWLFAKSGLPTSTRQDVVAVGCVGCVTGASRQK